MNEKGSGPQGRHPGARKAIEHNNRKQPPSKPETPPKASYPRRWRDDRVHLVREGAAWLLVTPAGHAWAFGSRREAIRDWARMSCAGLLSAPITLRVTIDAQADPKPICTSSRPVRARHGEPRPFQIS
jgi:hypothetical protein